MYVEEEEDERHKSGQYETLVVVILDISLWRALFFPFSGSEAYLLFNSISQLSINIETDNKQIFSESLF